MVVYDANVLYPSTLRDLLIRIPQAGLVQTKLTGRILDEMFDNLMANRPDLRPAALARTRELMNEAVRDCLVTGYEPIIAGLDLPDPNDRHVLAAAMEQIDLNPAAISAAVHAVAASWRNQPRYPHEVLEHLEAAGLPASAAVLRSAI